MAQLLKGVAVATSLCEDLLPRINKLVQAHITPTLAVIRVGENAGALSYERAAKKRADKLGCKLKVYAFDEDVSQQQLIAQITKINEDSSIHGCLLFRPLPKTLDERLICNTLLPQKMLTALHKVRFTVFLLVKRWVLLLVLHRLVWRCLIIMVLTSAVKMCALLVVR